MNFSQQPIAHGCRLTRWKWGSLGLLSMENGFIRITILLDRGGDLIEFRHKASDIDCLWKNSLCWPPRNKSLDLPVSGSESFYDVMHGGWFTSLPSGFLPTEYFGASMGCHGEILSVPAVAEIIHESFDRLEVRLTVSSLRTPLVLKRVILLEEGNLFIQITDTLSNRGEDPLPVAWLHHPAFGGPLLEQAQFISKATRICVPEYGAGQLQSDMETDWPYAIDRSGKSRDCSRIPEAGSGIEQVVHWKNFEFGWGALWSSKHNLGFGMRWDETLFPFAWSWISTAGKGYPLWGTAHVATIQPSTSPMKLFKTLLEENQTVSVRAGQPVGSSITAGFIRNSDEILPEFNAMPASPQP